MLLDENFDVVWQTPSTTTVLGYESTVGRNSIEFIHPDDMSIVVDVISRLSAREAADGDAPAFRADPTDIRLLKADGDWLNAEVVLFDHTADPAVRGYLVTCRVTADRRDIGRAVELLGTGAAVSEVLSLISRLVDKTLGGETHSTIAWWQENEVVWAWSPDRETQDPRIVEAAVNAVRVGVAEALTISDLDDPILLDAGAAARELGYSSACLTPIASPSSAEVLGCLLSWGHHAVEMTMYPQRPIHIGLRLAALAIVDGRTKNNLRWAASHDPLTLLINRAEFARRLDTMGENVAMLYIDLDDFKPINDVHGHSVGDAVLVEVAARIRETVGAAGIAGRLGGDEFAVAVPGIMEVAQGLDLAAEIIEALGRPIRVGNVMLGVGASVGVALGLQPLIPSVLIQRADEALLDAKSAGKNTAMAAA